MSPTVISSSSAGTASGKGLSRERVVEAALGYIDERGTSALSMRNLAQGLGVEAMSLYRYVNGREDLLEGVVAALLAGVSARMDDQPTEGWQEFLQHAAHEVRRVALDHPNAFPLLATRHPAAPWLRPPLRSIELVETFLTELRACGLSDHQAVDTYRAFSSFLLGQLLLEASVRGASTAPVEEPLDEGSADLPNQDAQLDLTDAPTVLRLRAMLSEDRSQEEFEISLETLLDRLDSALSQ